MFQDFEIVYMRMQFLVQGLVVKFRTQHIAGGSCHEFALRRVVSVEKLTLVL